MTNFYSENVCYMITRFQESLQVLRLIGHCISHNSFRKTLLNFIRPSENKIFSIYDQVGIKLLNSLRLGFSQLCKHKFWHNFEHTLNPLCSCSIDTKTTLHLFLWCHFPNNIREILMNELMNIDTSLLSVSQVKLISVLLYESDASHNKTNRNVLICTVQFIKDSYRFDDSLS